MSAKSFLKTGTEVLEARKGFRLVGRDADLERLTSILIRQKSSSIILVGPGGVGISALILGLQASKEAPDAPFDVISKRLFWLETDALFASGSSEQITDHFNQIIAVMDRTPDSVLIIEDGRDFIEAARANGLGNFINSLNNAVKNDKTQVIIETHDDDLDVILKAHTDMRERYTLLDVVEPTREALRAIVGDCCRDMAKHHGIRITEEAIDAAIELTSKYRTADAGLSRAQPERAMTLLDRALSTYRLTAHKGHPARDALIAELGAAVDSAEGRARLEALDAEFAVNQKEIKKLYKLQREGEAAILTLEQQIETQQAEDEARRKKLQGAATPAAPAAPVAPPKMDAFALMNAGGMESGEVQELRGKIRKFEEAVAENRTKFDALSAKINASLALSRDLVVAEFSRISGISASKLNQDERKKLLGLEDMMNAHVFGQQDAVHRLANAIKVAKAAGRESGQPLASFMFLGPSGVGKTELAKVLTQALLDDVSALTRFDMSEYMEKHAVAKLIGAPPGYEGFAAGGILTNLMRKNPVRVLLFDEIEKAHPDVFNIFLQILSDSRLSDNVGRVVSFDDAIIIMTTNIGAKGFLDPNLSEAEQYANAMKQLDEEYRPELLNRFAGRENIVCFKRLSLESIGRIVRREIDRLTGKYAGTGIGLTVPDTAIAAFCADRYVPERGARGLPGYIKANLEPVLANIALSRQDFSGQVCVTYDAAAHGFQTVVTESSCSANDDDKETAGVRSAA